MSDGIATADPYPQNTPNIGLWSSILVLVAELKETKAICYAI